nr:MAG TPA: hypothetical protein [Caudoviricetes sp.]
MEIFTMLTVREACTLINNPKEVDVAVNGNAYSLYGDFYHANR